jgi:hypothetical protein
MTAFKTRSNSLTMVSHHIDYCFQMLKSDLTVNQLNFQNLTILIFQK